MQTIGVAKPLDFKPTTKTTTTTTTTTTWCLVVSVLVLLSFEYSTHCVANLLLKQMHQKDNLLLFFNFFCEKKIRPTY